MKPFVTNNGLYVIVPESTKNHMLAHPDTKESDIAEAISKIYYVGGFVKEAVDLNRTVGKTACVKVTPNDEVLYFYRLNRAGATPFVKGKEKQDTSKVVVILREGKNGNPILITSYYGDLAPMEPWDARRKHCSEEEIAKCDEFWSTHALIYEPETIDFERRYG